MIALKQMGRKGLMRKVKKPLKIGKEEGMKIDAELRKYWIKMGNSWRRGMENYAKNPAVYNQDGINC